MEKREVSRENDVIIASIALCLTWSYFPVLTTTPNDWREGRMGQVPTIGTLFRRKKSTIKREKRETRGGGETPQHIRGTRKGFRNRAEN